MTFILGKKSRDKLAGVHPALVLVVQRAITLTSVDFTVMEGVRSPDRQNQLVQAGASWTLQGRHLRGADGFGKAIDLGALVGRRISWDWPLYYELAKAMRKASISEGIPIRWGGVWDRFLSDIEYDDQVDDAVADYVTRRKKLKLVANIDGPHFELPARDYP